MREPFRKSWARDTFESLVVTVVLALFGMTFVVQAFQIPTGSMENALLIGDHLLVSKFAFGGQRGLSLPGLAYREVRRGDIVVFRYPNDPTEYYVKRAIGIPGDRILIEIGRSISTGSSRRSLTFGIRIREASERATTSLPIFPNSSGA